MSDLFKNKLVAFKAFDTLFLKYIFRALIYLPKQDLKWKTTVQEQSVHKHISKEDFQETNELKWSPRKEAIEGPATVKDVLLSKEADD